MLGLVPSVTATTLTDEYTRARDTFGYDDDQLADLAPASVTSSFAPAAAKATILAEIDTWLAADR